jgi:molybdate transport system ATP-binding protein
VLVQNVTGNTKKEKETRSEATRSRELPGPIAKLVVTLKDVTVRVRDRHILPNTSWEIRAGQNWAILGPNGSGKSSLARLLVNDIPYSCGEIIFHGLNKRRIGYVSFELHEWFMTREDRLDEAQSFSGKPDSHERVRQTILAAREGSGGHPPLDEIVELMGIRHLLDRGTAFLSTGEMRRVLIARALLKAPRLLILDEPFGGIDETFRVRLTETLERLTKKGTQIILVTNRVKEIPPAITHVICVKNGRVVRQGRQGEVLTKRLVRDLYDREGPRLVSPATEGTRRPVTGAGDPDILVEMKNVSIRYGDITILDGLDWVMRRGEHWAIVGPNGSGKTTLLNLVSGDHPQAYANEIFLFGKRKGSGEMIWEIKEHIGMVSSRLQIQYRRGISAYEVVASGLFDSIGMYRFMTPAEHDRVRHWVDRLGLSSLSPRAFDQLSYGERRMVLIARAMVKSPRLLILDEPCEGLDGDHREKVLKLVNDIGSKTGTHLLFVTHYPDEIPPCITHRLHLEARNRGF